MKKVLGSVGLACLLFVESVQAVGDVNITIGTGGITGVYYPAGGSVCRLINQQRKEHGIRCAVESTKGSIYNLNALRTGDLELGIVQSDWQYHAYEGSDIFAEVGPHQSLRSVFALHPEPFTVVARSDALIRTFDDLRGKRVNIGEQGSGQRGTMDIVMQAKKWSLDDFGLVSELKASEQATALCDGRLDAMVYVVGHPSGAIKEATTFCDSVLVEVTGKEIDRLVADKSYYRKAVVPAQLYRGNQREVSTFGVAATLVARVEVSEEVIYQLVKIVFENFNLFRSLHPAFTHLKKEEMVRGVLTAPLHPGAVRYYTEAGLL